MNNLGNGDWQTVFENRNVWSLTNQKINNWIHQNSSFFKMVEKYSDDSLSILEIGCGPGRHALSLRKLNYNVSAIDISEQIIEQAKKNEINVFGNTEILFSVKDMFKLKDHYSNEEFSLITHGGLMEHFEDNKLIIQNLKDQLSICKYVVFDIPIKSRKNDILFQKDTIYRNLKSVPEWISLIETEFKVLEYQIEKHAPLNMTDDLIIVAGKHGI